MNRNLSRFLPLVLLLISSAYAVRVGEPAPDFQATDSSGQVQKLSQYRGKFVVLEWHNNGCPYTRKHYESGNMQRLQRAWTGKGVVWFTVISSAPGQQGYVTAQQENDYLRQMKASPSAALLDPQGTVGRLYSAKTTPICLSSVLRVCWSTTAPSTTKRQLTKPISQPPRTTFREHWRKQWQTSK